MWSITERNLLRSGSRDTPVIKTNTGVTIVACDLKIPKSRRICPKTEGSKNQMLNKNDNKTQKLKPLISIFLILMSLFVTAFFKISLRRLSYSLYEANKKFDAIQDEYSSNLRIYRKRTQTENLDQLKKSSLKNKKKGQIIQVIDGRATVID